MLCEIVKPSFLFFWAVTILHNTVVLLDASVFGRCLVVVGRFGSVFGHFWSVVGRFGSVLVGFWSFLVVFCRFLVGFGRFRSVLVDCRSISVSFGPFQVGFGRRSNPPKNQRKQNRRVVTKLSCEMLCEIVKPSFLFFGAATIFLKNTVNKKNNNSNNSNNRAGTCRIKPGSIDGPKIVPQCYRQAQGGEEKGF